MELNADFSRRASVHAGSMPWAPSPVPGVDRRMLDRMGDEVARATSIVRYAPKSAFSPHVHTGGEEFLVLDGVFQDEHGDYPVGTYVRNPPQSQHTPRSQPGCTIFVKLWQFDLSDREQIVHDTNALAFESVPDRDGVSEIHLYTDANERVSLEQWQPQSTIKLPSPHGLEVLVVEGEFTEPHQSSDEVFHRYSWLRLPSGASTEVRSGSQGTKVWIKRDHLRETPLPPQQRA